MERSDEEIENNNPTNKVDKEDNNDIKKDKSANKQKDEKKEPSRARRGKGPTLIPNQRYVDHMYTTLNRNQLTSAEIMNLRLYNQSTIDGPFPIKLQTLLKTAEELGFQDIISWLPHGRAFIIRRPQLFEKKIMEKYFVHTKFTSFKRQLNIYDFKRITHGVDSCSYYHEMFLRGKPLLAMKMVPRKIKGNIRVSTYIDYEPPFYSMPFLDPLFGPPHRSVEHFNQSPRNNRIVGEEPSLPTKMAPLPMKTKGKISFSAYDDHEPQLGSMPFMNPKFNPHHRSLEYYDETSQTVNSDVPSVVIEEGHLNGFGRSLQSSSDSQFVTKTTFSPHYDDHRLSQQHYYIQPLTVSYVPQQYYFQDKNAMSMKNQSLHYQRNPNYHFEQSTFSEQPSNIHMVQNEHYYLTRSPSSIRDFESPSYLSYKNNFNSQQPIFSSSVEQYQGLSSM